MSASKYFSINCSVSPIATPDLKSKNTIYPEIGVSPNGMFLILHILPLDFKCRFVQ